MWQVGSAAASVATLVIAVAVAVAIDGRCPAGTGYRRVSCSAAAPLLDLASHVGHIHEAGPVVLVLDSVLHPTLHGGFIQVVLKTDDVVDVKLPNCQIFGKFIVGAEAVKYMAKGKA